MKSAIGKLLIADAEAFLFQNPTARAGSMTGDGYRRIFTYESGDELIRLVNRIAEISGAAPVVDAQIVTKEMEGIMPLAPCSHRGSKRSTCCGTPDMWICRLHKADCLESEYDKAKLISQVQTPEAKSILCCAVCSDYATDGV